MDFFSTGVLERVIPDLTTDPLYLTGTFFPNTQQNDTEEIHFDVIKGNGRRISPFVTPLQQGQLVEKIGWYTQTLKPAYVKDKRVFDANAPMRRAPGEKLLGSMSPQERQNAMIRIELTDQINMLNRRIEVMCGQVLATGTVTIVGDLYPLTVINYARNASQTVVLAGAARWGQAGVDPLANMQTWANTTFSLSGARPFRFVMTPDAYALFVASASVQQHLNRFRNDNSLNDRSIRHIDGWDAGEIGGFQITVYHGTYIDPATNTPANILPPYSVIAAPPEMEGYRAFGAIRDEKAGYKAMAYFPKSWVEEDPAVRYIMLQSAPLVVPLRPDASFAATVN